MSAKKGLDLRRAKALFTLIEIFIVIGLIGIIAAVSAFPIKKALAKEQFQSNLERFLAKTRLAQELVVDYQTDVFLTLEQTEQGLLCKLTPVVQLPKALAQALNRDALLQGITSFSFEAEPKNQLEIAFLHNSLATQGVLTFYSKTQELGQVYLSLSITYVVKNGNKIALEKAPYPHEAGNKKI